MTTLADTRFSLVTIADFPFRFGNTGEFAFCFTCLCLTPAISSMHTALLCYRFVTNPSDRIASKVLILLALRVWHPACIYRGMGANTNINLTKGDGMLPEDCKEITIKVTQKDIEKGIQWDAKQNPIARAAKRQHKDFIATLTTECTLGYAYDKDVCMRQSILARTAQEFGVKFDKGEPVEPFEFTMLVQTENYMACDYTL